MKKSLKVLAAATFFALLVTEFNNCGQYAQPNSFDGTSSVNCTTANCITPIPDYLKITPHLFNGQYSVPANLSEFNVGGDCNESGYPYNKIRWELVLNGVVVRNSGMSVTGSGGADTLCVNGRFLIYVNLAAITEDKVDRTGLSVDGTATNRTSYDLKVYLYGQMSPYSQPVSSPQSVSVVPLIAI